jgi:hypothetical protein
MSESKVTCEVSGSPIRKRAMQTQIVTGPLLPWSVGKKSSNVEMMIKIVPKSVPTPENDNHNIYKCSCLISSYHI